MLLKTTHIFATTPDILVSLKLPTIGKIKTRKLLKHETSILRYYVKILILAKTKKSLVTRLIAFVQGFIFVAL